MKRFLQLALVIAAASAFAISSADAARPGRPHRPRITKNEAQHLVLKKFPNAKIAGVELKRGKHRSAWIVQLTQAGGSGPTQVRVDRRSGRILQ